jgi:hypothetical protein
MIFEWKQVLTGWLAFLAASLSIEKFMAKFTPAPIPVMARSRRYGTGEGIRRKAF